MPPIKQSFIVKVRVTPQHEWSYVTTVLGKTQAQKIAEAYIKSRISIYPLVEMMIEKE